MDNQKIKIVDGFVWLLITDKAKEVYQSGLFDGSIYVLDDDLSEGLCESYEDLLKALENGCDIALEVGYITERGARIILNDALTNGATMEQIWYSITDALENKEGYVPLYDEDED